MSKRHLSHAVIKQTSKDKGASLLLWERGEEVWWKNFQEFSYIMPSRQCLQPSTTATTIEYFLESFLLHSGTSFVVTKQEVPAAVRVASWHFCLFVECQQVCTKYQVDELPT